MALRAVKPEAIQKRLKVFFYGMAGVGKTTAAISFPKVYMIDTERGAENSQYVDRLAKNGGVIFQTSDFMEVIKEVKALLSEKHDYRTIVIDPMTTLYNDLVDRCEEKVGSQFGAHYKEANKHIKHLFNLLLRIDANVIITSHSKTEYGNNMTVIGQTFDCYKKLDYLFDIVFEVQKRGKERVGVIKKSRIESFPDGETIPFCYSEIANRYGKDILERDAIPENLASEQQISEVIRLIDLIKIPEETWGKWLKKSDSENWSEMPSSVIQKCIDSLKDKIKGEAA